MFRFLELVADPPPLTIIDVGAASMGEGTDPYAALTRYPHVRVIGFEPNQEACRQRNQSARPGHRYLPHFVGDGSPRTFYECQNPLCSSLYPPDSERLALFQRMDLPVVGSQPVETVTLDSLADIEDCDLLKLDVQGAELDVIRGAGRVLAKSSVVHTEVEFIPLYKGQCLFGDIDVALRAKGYLFHRFVELFSRQFKPLVFNNNLFSPGSQLLYAEAAVYVRDFASLDRLTPGKLINLATILHDVYGSVDFACVALAAHDRLGGPPLLPAYLEKLTGRRDAA